MWYSVLLTGNTFNEYSLFLEKNKELEEFEVSLLTFNYFYGREKWNGVINKFTSQITMFSTCNLYKENLGGSTILVHSGFLAILQDDKVRILINITDKNVYIDKYFERDYKQIFLKFKNILLSLYSTSKDIIYTDNTGKCCFYQFEKPKFKAISERKEYINQLLDTLNE